MESELDARRAAARVWVRRLRSGDPTDDAPPGFRRSPFYAIGLPHDDGALEDLLADSRFELVSTTRYRWLVCHRMKIR